MNVVYDENKNKKDLIMKAIIFLDIDGVLAQKKMFSPYEPDPFLKERLVKAKNDPGIGRLPDTLVNQIFHHFDPESCGLIRMLCQAYDAKLVITSSWRLFYNEEQLRAIINIFDLGAYMIGATRPGLPRYQVIREYIVEHDVKRYVVVDDLNMSRQFPNHFVLASYRFESEQYEQTKRLLSWQR